MLDERKLEYDVVIVALGSRANDFNIPGVAKHCLFINNFVESVDFNDKFRMEQLRAFGEGQPLEIAIVGGGATGTQLAAELHKALDLASLYSFEKKRPDIRLSLLEAGPRILPAFPEAVSAAAAEQLQKINITVRMSAQVSSVDEYGFLLKSGERVPATLRVWAAGVRTPEVTRRFGGLKLGKTGQIEVRSNLQSVEDDAIFAVGDCAYIVDAPVAPTAQAARQQAHHLALHMPAWIDGRPIPPFAFHNKGAIVALGNYNGWGTFPGGTIFGGGWLHGLSARLGHVMLYRQHQFELYGALRGSLSWLVDWLEKFVNPSIKLD